MATLLRVVAPPDAFQPPVPYPLILSTGTVVNDADVAAITASARATGVVLTVQAGYDPPVANAGVISVDGLTGVVVLVDRYAPTPPDGTPDGAVLTSIAEAPVYAAVPGTGAGSVSIGDL